MADETSEDKDLPPSERKLQKARDDGSILKAPDLFFLMTCACAIGASWMLKEGYVKEWLKLWDWNAFWSLKDGLKVDKMWDSITAVLGLTMIGIAFAGGVSALGAWALGGFLWNPGLIGFKWNRINPFEKITNMITHLGSSVGWPLVKGLTGMMVGGVGVYLFVQDWKVKHDGITALAKGMMPLLGLLFLIAGLDLFIQWSKRMKDLGMTLQELKDELKETDGNPEVKSRQRSIARQRAQGRMMTAVAGADVVVVNPEHFLVAIKWNAQKHAAPIVVAKGLDRVALALKEEAKKNQVPVLEAPPFARALWAKTKLDQPIPLSYFEPVAALLAWAYAVRDQRPVSEPVLMIPQEGNE